MNYYENLSTELAYLKQFYTYAQIDTYAKGKPEKVVKLYNLTQPKQVPIGSLMGKVHENNILVSSPDGWVPVLDCIEKVKKDLYTFEFASGKKIVASHDHLYQSPDQQWHYARDIPIGSTLLSENGVDTVINILPQSKQTKVYDLSVNHDNHRYYTNGICSHNSGKSLVMMNIALSWLEQGLSGVYISLELSEELCGLRTDAMLSGMSTKDIRKDLETAELKVKMFGKKAGKYRMKALPAQSNINDVRSYIKEVQVQTGMKIDFVMMDYLDLLMPVSTKVSPNDLFIKDKYVSEELRNLAKELNVLLVTASQLNRSSVEEIEYDHSHISGGISKINTADNVFGIFTSRAMKERGRYQLQCMKTRTSNGTGQKVELEYNIETMRITDLPEDAGAVSAYNKPNIFNSIKTQSKVVDDSQEESGKITAEVQSNKLKQLLGQIKQG
jgi:DnaB-like helicase C terminal domain